MNNKNHVVVLKNKPAPYAMEWDDVANDLRITWEARGIMALMLASPKKQWTVNEVLACGSDDPNVIRAAINELRAYGYAVPITDDDTQKH